MLSPPPGGFMVARFQKAREECTFLSISNGSTPHLRANISKGPIVNPKNRAQKAHKNSKGGEMNQALYAHMNNKRKKIKKKKNKIK
jgi:hypothetical protein